MLGELTEEKKESFDKDDRVVPLKYSFSFFVALSRKKYLKFDTRFNSLCVAEI